MPNRNSNVTGSSDVSRHVHDTKDAKIPPVSLKLTPEAWEEYQGLRGDARVPLDRLRTVAAYLIGNQQMTAVYGDDGKLHVTVDPRGYHGLYNLARKHWRQPQPHHNGRKPAAKRSSRPPVEYERDRTRRAIEYAKHRLKMSEQFNPDLDFPEVEKLIEKTEAGFGDKNPNFDDIKLSANEARYSVEKAVLNFRADELRLLNSNNGTLVDVEFRIGRALGLPFNDALRDFSEIRKDIRRTSTPTGDEFQPPPRRESRHGKGYKPRQHQHRRGDDDGQGGKPPAAGRGDDDPITLDNVMWRVDFTPAAASKLKRGCR